MNGKTLMDAYLEAGYQAGLAGEPMDTNPHSGPYSRGVWEGGWWSGDRKRKQQAETAAESPKPFQWPTGPDRVKELTRLAGLLRELCRIPSDAQCESHEVACETGARALLAMGMSGDSWDLTRAPDDSLLAEVRRRRLRVGGSHGLPWPEVVPHGDELEAWRMIIAAALKTAHPKHTRRRQWILQQINTYVHPPDVPVNGLTDTTHTYPRHEHDTPEEYECGFCNGTGLGANAERESCAMCGGSGKTTQTYREQREAEDRATARGAKCLDGHSWLGFANPNAPHRCAICGIRKEDA